MDLMGRTEIWTNDVSKGSAYARAERWEFTGSAEEGARGSQSHVQESSLESRVLLLCPIHDSI